jgi:hypothetical protein
MALPGGEHALSDPDAIELVNGALEALIDHVHADFPRRLESRRIWHRAGCCRSLSRP